GEFSAAFPCIMAALWYFVLRKMAKLMKPQKVIQQNGDVFTIRTISSLRNYAIEFTVGKEFDEETKGVDNQKLKSLVTWDNGRLVCVQIGEKKNRGWVHWLEGDDLHLIQRQTATKHTKQK
uniref:Retinol binding protein 7 n=1 Tax=Leptobrachium leishanense TaxID=445787 RepID=A0A8C5N250_9ANUR